MPQLHLSISEEVEAAIKIGSAEKSLDSIRRVTDLFLSSAAGLSNEQIELFDEVLERLVRTIEIRALADVSARMALAEISAQLAPIAQAPPSVVRRLACNEEIAIAGPVLTESARLRPGGNRGQEQRAAPAGHFGPVVAKGSNHRRIAGSALSERQPPDHREPRRPRLSRWVCHHYSAS